MKILALLFMCLTLMNPLIVMANEPITNNKLKIQNVTLLVLDLNNKGIEVVSNKRILFDFNGDGNKIGTSWIKQGGILVFDHNNNGQIDNGTELFGDGTLKQDGTYAKDGFDALQDLDTNKDGIFDNKDKNFNNVKIWQDFSQEASVGLNELKTLTELGIESIKLTSNLVNEPAKSNKKYEKSIIVSKSDFIKKDGAVGVINYVKLAPNPFYRQFKNRVPVLQMSGSGAVRDLQAAAILDHHLSDILQQYAQLKTRKEQKEAIEGLLFAWANTANFNNSYKKIEQLSDQTASFRFAYSWELLGEKSTENQLAEKELLEKLLITEAFSGDSFYHFKRIIDDKGQIAVIVYEGNYVAETTVYPIEQKGTYYLTEKQLLPQAQQWRKDLIRDGYHKISDGAYNRLIMQTRFYDYLLNVRECSQTNCTDNFSQFLLDGTITKDPVQRITNSYELISEMPFGGYFISQTVATLVSAFKQLPEDQLEALKKQLGNDITVLVGTHDNDPIIGKKGINFIKGQLGNNLIVGNDKNDLLVGGIGNDTLKGNKGRDS